MFANRNRVLSAAGIVGVVAMVAIIAFAVVIRRNASGVPVPGDEFDKIQVNDANGKPVTISFFESSSKEGSEVLMFWLPLEGAEEVQGNKVLWCIDASVVEKEIYGTFKILCGETDKPVLEFERSFPLILVAGNVRFDLESRPHQTQHGDKTISVADFSMRFTELLAIAKMPHPRVVFGPFVCDLGPQGQQAAKELVRRLARIQQRNSGFTPQQAEAHIREWLGER